MSSKVREFPYFDGSGSIKDFLKAFEVDVPEEWRFWALELAMRVTPARWWETHKEAFQDWGECRKMMVLRFDPLVNPPMELFLGQGDLCKHLPIWKEVWNEKTWNEWVHMFIHVLGSIPTTWYLDAELHQRTYHWGTMAEDL